MKYLLEYEEAELKGLLGDLERVGQAEERAFSIWLFVLEFRDDTGRKRSVFLPVAEGTFWSSGNLEEDKGLIYKRLKSGDFETRGVDYSEDTLSEKPLLSFLSNSSLRSFFGTSSPYFQSPLTKGVARLALKSLKGLLYDLGSVATKIQNTIYPGKKDVEENRMGVVLFYGRERDVKSLTTNRILETGIAGWFGDYDLPGVATVDFTEIKGRKPEIRPA